VLVEEGVGAMVLIGFEEDQNRICSGSTTRTRRTGIQSSTEDNEVRGRGEGRRKRRRKGRRKERKKIDQGSKIVLLDGLA
jgi:hypothetical protein